MVVVLVRMAIVLVEVPILMANASTFHCDDDVDDVDDDDDADNAASCKIG